MRRPIAFLYFGRRNICLNIGRLVRTPVGVASLLVACKPLLRSPRCFATAATLRAVGKNNIDTAADAVRALEPVAGHFAGIIFAVGLVGASLLAAAVLPLATSYAVSEAFGFSKRVGLDFRRAPLFFTLFTGLIIFGAAAALIPNLPVIKLLVLIQVLNGVLLPIFLVFILLLINDQRLTNELKILVFTTY